MQNTPSESFNSNIFWLPYTWTWNMLPQYLTWWYLLLHHHSHPLPLPSPCFHYHLLLAHAIATGCMPLWSLWTGHGPTEMIWRIFYFSFGWIPPYKTKSVTLKITEIECTVKEQWFFFFYLSSDSWEFEGLEGFVIDGGTWIDVDHHAGGSSATEVTLQNPGQFTIPEGHHLRGSRPVDVFKKFFRL